jgi:holin-like protein
VPVLKGLLVLLVFQCFGEAIKLSLDISVPGPVIGMVLLFLGLVLRGSPGTSLVKASQVLIPLLGLMFLPASAGLFFLGSTFDNQWPAILAAVIIGSIASLFFNALIMKWLTRHREL